MEVGEDARLEPKYIQSIYKLLAYEEAMATKKTLRIKLPNS
jgi:hypothetical protein